ncbi:MAG TPA: class E sortase [Nocardioidaceae bacterium]|nr:class E sortase [Nocardioidaceae bacterium]
MTQQTQVRPPARRRTRRGSAFWVGIVLVLAGLGLLCYVGWQFFGTNVVAAHKQHQIVIATKRVWQSEGSGAASARTHGVVLQGAQALIRIPKFGKDYVMPVQAGVSDEVLAEGFGHFKGTAKPGGKGNYALAAHRVTHGEPLRHMPELRPGDKVIVETERTTYTYVLDTNPNKLIVPFTSTWVIDPHPHNPDPGGVQPAHDPRLITLTTCSELFHTDNRMIAFGHLVSKTTR